MGYYHNNNGVLEPIAGRGRAEYGASTIRTGTYLIPAITAGTYVYTDVVFDTPMPDTNYLVNVDGIEWGRFMFNVTSKTQNGFRLSITRMTGDTDYPGDKSIRWTAFKLYTDTEYNKLLDLPFVDITSQCTFQNLGTDARPRVRVSRGNQNIQITGSFNPQNMVSTGGLEYSHILIPQSLLSNDGTEMAMTETGFWCSNYGSPRCILRMFSPHSSQYLGLQFTGQTVGLTGTLESTATVRDSRILQYYPA